MKEIFLKLCSVSKTIAWAQSQFTILENLKIEKLVANLHDKSKNVIPVIYKETLFIRNTCLSDTSCFQIIISHSCDCYFVKLLCGICLLWIYKCDNYSNYIKLGNLYLLYKILLWCISHLKSIYQELNKWVYSHPDWIYYMVPGVEKVIKIGLNQCN